MRILNIELPNKKVLHLEELRSGDVEIEVRERVQDGKILSKPIIVTKIVIPKDRRLMLENFMHVLP